MSKLLRVSDEVYEALKILKVFPSTSFNEIIKGLIDLSFPGDFFDTDAIDRQLFREAMGMEDYAPGELRQIVKKRKKGRNIDEHEEVD